MNPFTVLGLPTDPDLTDEQVRAAWRAIAAATHPDRPDGGNMHRYTAAATAYAQLRTAWGRSEAYADLAADQPYVPAPASLPVSPGARIVRAAPAGPGPHPARAALASAGPRPGRRARCRCWWSTCCRDSHPARPSSRAWSPGFCSPARGDLAPPPGR